MKTQSSMVIIVIATLLGLFFGNALNGLIGAAILGAISAACAWFAMSRHEASMEATPANTATTIGDPPIARFLFQDVRAAALWLPLRLFVAYEWIEGGLHKMENPAWMNGGTAIRGYWERAVAVNPDTGTGPITYDWWRGFLQTLLDADAHTWFGPLIAVGEFMVGLGLVFGALVGIAAFFGAFMNISFLLSGSTSSNPVMLLLGFGLVLAWKVAGFIGLDRVLLPLLGTPWQRGKLVQTRAATPQTA